MKIFITVAFEPLIASKEHGIVSRGGIETYCLNLIKHALADGHTVTVLVPDDSDLSLYDCPNLIVKKMGVNSRANGGKPPKYNVFADNLLNGRYGEFDLIINNNATYNRTMLESLFHYVMTRPNCCAFTIGHCIPDTFRMIDERANRIATWETESKGRFMLLSNSPYTAKRWKKFCPSIVIDLGVENSDIVRSYDNELPPVATYVGRVIDEKRPQIILQASTNYKINSKEPSKYGTLPCEIVGNMVKPDKKSDEFRTKFMDLVRNTNSEKSIIGEIDRDRILQYISRGNRYIATATGLPESFGLIVPEAWSVGVPVMVKGSGNLSNFILNDSTETFYEDKYMTCTDTGVLVKSIPGRGDLLSWRKAMEWMTENIGLYSSEHLRSIQRRKYSFPVMFHRILDLYKLILESEFPIETRYVPFKSYRGDICLYEDKKYSKMEIPGFEYVYDQKQFESGSLESRENSLPLE